MSPRTTPTGSLKVGSRVVIKVAARLGETATISRSQSRRPWTRTFYWLTDDDGHDLGWYENHEIEPEATG